VSNRFAALTAIAKTLDDWCLESGIFPTKMKNSRCVYVWCDITEPLRGELWQLSDYRVSSVSGLTVYLMPKGA
jgi:hypothetical protein